MSRAFVPLACAGLLAFVSAGPVGCGAKTGNDLFPDGSAVFPGDGGAAGDSSLAGAGGEPANGGTGNVGNNGGTGNVGNNGGAGNVGNNGGAGNVGNNGGAGNVGNNGGTGGMPHPPPTECCFPHDFPGCGEPDVMNCVCDRDPFCCGSVWDERCVDEAFVCGGCDEPPPPPPPPPMSECCFPHEFPGCGDPGVMNCVCERDPFCCTNAWDEKCVDGAFVCGGCDEPPPPPPPMSECCFPHEFPGCGDPGVMNCVCERDPFCCSSAWDEKCVDRAFACGGCDEPPPPPPPPGGGGWGGPYPDPMSCLMDSADQCKACVCVACLDGFNACTMDQGCMEILDCVMATGCQGPACLLPWNCAGVIFGSGGPGSPSLQNAQELYQCSTGSGCPCI